MATTAQHDATQHAPLKPVSFMPRDVEYQRDADGSIRLQSRVPLRATKQHLLDYLHHHATLRPETVWIAARGPHRDDWATITFGEARAAVDELTQGLLSRRSDENKPIAMLGDNSIEYALMMLAAMQARIPIVPISAAYAMPGGDYRRLQGLIDMVRPGFFFVDSLDRFGDALQSLQMEDVRIVHLQGSRDDLRSEPFDQLREAPSPDVQASREAIDPAAPTRYMFTSGSTGSPKAVTHTQRALVDAAESLLQVTGVSEGDRMVRLDWTPWSHVFGSTNLALTLVAGGTFYIDAGKPTPGGMAETLRNLREVSPTGYANVPAGFAALIDALEADAALARTFFQNVEFISYAAARLPEDVVQRLQALSVAHCGHQLPITSGYGATETTATGAFVHWPTVSTGLIGLPQPGVEFKLVPVDESRFEVRQRGIGIFGGYLGNPDATAAAFDEQGWYKSGDAAMFVNPDAPEEGLVFAGRLTEEFKLQTGTFVKVGPLRAAFLDHVAPLVQDVVLCGENEAFLAALIWINAAHCSSLAGIAMEDRAALNAHPAVRGAITDAIAAFNKSHPSSSERICRAVLLDQPPSLATGEMTDKGTINQALVRRLRADQVSAMFASPLSPNVISIP